MPRHPRRLDVNPTILTSAHSPPRTAAVTAVLAPAASFKGPPPGRRQCLLRQPPCDTNGESKVWVAPDTESSFPETNSLENKLHGKNSSLEKNLRGKHLHGKTNSMENYSMEKTPPWKNTPRKNTSMEKSSTEHYSMGEKKNINLRPWKQRVRGLDAVTVAASGQSNCKLLVTSIPARQAALTECWTVGDFSTKEITNISRKEANETTDTELHPTSFL
jgi:hypothetical protein